MTQRQRDIATVLLLLLIAISIIVIPTTRDFKRPRQPVAVSGPQAGWYGITPELSRQVATGAKSNSETQRCANFIIFSRQRSASTTFVKLLTDHPDLHSFYEVINSFNEKNMGQLHSLAKKELGLRTKEELLARLPEFINMIWKHCPETTGCGFKLFDRQLARAPMRSLFYYHNNTPIAEYGGPGVRALVLERTDVKAAYNSWYRAITTGNWGTNPEAQKHFDAEKGGWSNVQLANGQRGQYPQYRRRHQKWFYAVRHFLHRERIPMLNLRSEDLIANSSRVMKEVHQFLCENPEAVMKRPLCDNLGFNSACDGLKARRQESREREGEGRTLEEVQRLYSR